MYVNPLTDNYYTLKKLVLSGEFSWFKERSGCDDFDFYCHVFVGRPEQGSFRFPTVNSDWAQLAHQVFLEICEANDIEVECFYRMAANTIHPSVERKFSNMHTDHDFPHKNMLVHLTDAGGGTLVQDNLLSSGEDEVIFFEGEHCAEFPIEKPRTVLVATFLERGR